MALHKLIQQGKARLVCGDKGKPVGIAFDPAKHPTLAEMIEVAKDVHLYAGREETRLKLMLGDVLAATEGMPGSSKREQVDAVFGKNAYATLRKYAHVARAFPFDATFSDGTPRRRVDVNFSFLQELSPAWVPEDIRQELLREAADGTITVTMVRARLEPHKPPSARKNNNIIKMPVPDSATVSDAPVSEDSTPTLPAPASITPPVVRGLWEAEYDRMIFIPERVDGYEIPGQMMPLLDLLDRRARQGNILNLLLHGPAGSGKTTLVHQFAALTRRRLFPFNCGTVKSEGEWWGVREAENGRTYYRPSPLVYALQLGGSVILLDELNRIPPHLLNPLMSVLDDSRATITPGGQYIRVAPGTVIIGMANLGEAYAGTYVLDQAVLSRMKTICELTEVNSVQLKRSLRERTGCTEKVADLLIKCLEKIKAMIPNTTLGMRQLLEAAEWIVTGMSVRTACKITILEYCALENPGCRQQVENILDGLIGADMK